MKKTLIPFVASLALLIACESTPHYNRTKMVMLGTQLPKKPYGSVKLYQSKEEVPANYDVIALFSVEGRAGEEALFIKAFLYRAADIGADGVIFYHAGLGAGAEGGGWVLTPRGGFGMPANPSLEAAYRGEAIHIK